MSSDPRSVPASAAGTQPAVAPGLGPPEISIVVPVYNEEESLPQLHAEIAQHVGGMNRPWRVIYVDDHSTDRSLEVLLSLRGDDPHVRVVHFRRNFGQTAAMSAGFEHSRGRVVITLDADLQNDPADIPRLVEELERGYDIVVGWRKDRHDGFLLRRLPSRIANRLIVRVTGADVHDTGCTLKAYRRELVENLPIYAEQHRFLPVLSLASGARMSEVVVNHRPRIYGVSKYGLGRAVRVLLDLLTVKMLSSFSRSPLQYFALLAMPFAALTAFFLAVGIANYGEISFDNKWGQSVLLTFMLFSMACIYFLLLGLLAELVVKVSGLHGRKSFDPLSAGGEG
ncbi:MAG: glycosyltransferase family 2 protein [bacterium]|nr:glycosyltransferase family 2 protein [bacterium]